MRAVEQSIESSSVNPPDSQAAALDRQAISARGALVLPVSIAVAHGLNDLYAAFLHPLLPRIMERLDLNIALAATLAMTLSLAASLVQPVMGHVADRFGRRLFVVLGPALSAVFMSMIGLAPSFIVLALFLALAGLGSAAFHPPAASLAAGAGSRATMGARYSYFSFGGSLGYALGPLVAVALVNRGGFEGLAYAMIPMLLFAPLLFLLVPSGAHERRQRAHAPAAPLRLLTLLAGPLGLVFGISAVGAFVQRVYLTMQPIMISRAGLPETAGAAALSLYLGAQALGSLGGGFLADRVDRRTLLLHLSGWSLPAHALAFWLPHGSAFGIAATFAAGFLNMALLPPIVLLAQELLPNGASLGAGIVMGAAWATGSIAMLGIGVLADQIGAQAAALAALPAILVAVGLALALPRMPARG
jgi:FSR family fosmidomycin resistance protein-like MFS transporter